MDQDHNRRLLAVLAHPDDESFGPGGTLALYAQRGVEVHLICATQGELGDVPPELLEGYESVAKLRLDELRCAASHLDLTDIHLLGYRDSGMPGSADNQHPEALAAADLSEVTARVAHLMRQIKPQVVITFDPYGGYGHPDHIAIQRAAKGAFHAAGNPDRYPDGLPPYQPQKLYYHTFPRGLIRLAVRLMPLFGQDPHHFGRNKDIDLATFAFHNYPVHARIDIRQAAEEKRLASACHSSQSGPPPRGIMRLFFRMLGEDESFMRVYPPVNSKPRERDLFEGISFNATN